MAVDLGQLEQDLNNDEKLRDRFLDDPVGTLHGRGVTLSKAMEEQLRTFVGRLKSSGQDVAGSSVARGEHASDISINIGKSF